jgi:hypothetical protein
MSEIYPCPIIKRESLSIFLYLRDQLTQCKYRRKREQSKMLLRSGRREPRNEDRAKFTDRHRLRLEVASVQHLAFLSGIAPTELGRQWR